ncbi:chaperone protein dnaJ C76, chloroplastic [Arachis stenosperma]|uniref:chaperone protein dnaJ C76, chloroplastic n=1 Tax=Arachis stenosperma TaxID=217475 RepID=UPI0025AD4D47|nr:chaperone protein dnaJ C76, chloroplastic [Arachis stenosperma]
MAMSAAASTWLIPCMARTHGEQLKLHNKYSSSSSSRHSRIRCNCKASSWMTSELDLYDLLGIDNTSGQSEVKTAYRSLQKRCHPDIAGPAGHDMSIILNQAYAILSDPNARLSYDREQAKISEFKGFTGRPLYSVWRGSQTEQRAIFVDEIKCVGCLKCALLANNTFAIESVYGRARVVAQWADSHHKIQDAIDSCPVNCISLVERSNLAALEFLMSKQPRGNVRVGAGNAAGVRVSNIFVDVDKFQKRFQETMDKASKCSKETDLQRESRMSAIQAIRSISNWLYWQSPSACGSSEKNMTRVTYQLPEPDIGKLRDAAARKKLRDQIPQACHRPEEYWAPSTYALPSSTTKTATPPRPAEKPSAIKGKNEYENQNSPIRWGFPIVTALIAVATVRLHEAESVPELKQHIGGNLALEIVNSPWMQYILAAATWYMMGMAIIELVAIIGNKER